MVKIIGISGMSGSGKSALTEALGKRLHAETLCWDDFDGISQDQKDYAKRYNMSRDYHGWRYDALVEVLKQLKSGKKIICPVTEKALTPTDYIIFEAPLGRKHVATGQYIDYLIFLNTPLDIALARKVRDFRDKSNLDIAEIFEELDFYLATSRSLYTMYYEKVKKSSDYAVDGNQSLDDIVASVVQKIQTDGIC
ncbi:MAG TPA: hypothetical protein VNC84_01195 [Gammaproteobacteria bacterium]|nr:hypothetical protein [Gammaproteobacteria bacterium]